MRFNLKPLHAAILMACLNPFAAQAAVAPILGDTNLAASNVGSAVSLNVNPTNKSLLNFNLSALPSGIIGSDIAKATLVFYVKSVSTNGAVQAAPITSTWDESTVTSGTAPTQGAPEPPNTTINRGNSYFALDVTNLVQDWVNSPATNFGLALGPVGTASLILDSKEAIQTSHPAYIEIVLQGPAGAQGPQGAAGTNGSQGPQGANGTDGSQGPQGANGTDGSQGPQGANGTDGSQGPQGANGTDGSQGPQGANGTDGLQGPQGANGTDGSQGPQGASGTNGSQGPQGANGTDGSQGPQGANGTDGSQGSQGATGATGATGNIGATGATGPNDLSASTTTSFNALLKGTGTNVAAATAGTDYLSPSGSGANLTNLNASNLASGTVPAARMPALTGDVNSSAGSTATSVVRLQGTSVSATAPTTNGQVLTYNGSAWAPAAAASGGIGTLMLGRTGILPASAATGYVAPLGPSTYQTTENIAWMLLPVDCTFGNVRGTASANLTANFTLSLNGNPTALSCDFAGGTSCTGSGSVSLSAGNTISWKVALTAPGAAIQTQISATCK